METARKRIVRISVIATLAVLLIAAVVLFAVLRNEQTLEQIQKEELSILDERRGEYDEYSIVLPATSRSEAQSLAAKLGAELRLSSDGSFATLTLTDGRTIRDVYADDANRKYLSSFSADYKAKISDILTEEEHRYPTPPTVGNAGELSSALNYLNLGNVWNRTKGSGITVAVIDTGIDTDHPEFSGRISEYSYNATEDKIVKDWLLEDSSYDWSLVEDEQGHGTSVAAALAAASDNSGMVGVAPEVTIIVIKADCNEKGEFERTSDLVFGLYYAIERDVSVVNMSFGIQLINPFAEATRLAYDSDVICVAAAGNESTASLTFPAADPLVIGVGALASDSWELASYSNYGENVDVVAPGSVYTAKMGGGYKTATGTSLASPLVAGTVALLCVTDRYITYDEVTELLYASSYDLGDLGRDFDYGFGALDAMALIIEERGTLTLDMMTDELEDQEALFIRNHTLQEMLEPERYFAVFDGWYYDPYYTEPYNYYEDKFVSDITLYAKWSGEDDGIPFTYVELDDGTIEIRSYTGRRRYISVPDYIDGKLVTSIGDFAFSGETGLREINLPSGLNNIGIYAFENCTNLVSMEIPEGVTALGEGAFYNAVRMSSIAFAGSPKITAIGDQAFAYCSSLRRIELPEKVTSVNGSAFLGTTSLSAINVNKANKSFVSKDGVLYNKTMSTLVAYPAGLSANYTLPDGTREIGAYAFAFTKARAVVLNKVEKIGDAAFTNSYLYEVVIPDSVTSLGKGAFAKSFYLSSVTLGGGLSEISADAFGSCESLREIVIPKGIKSIGVAAFASSGLTSVEFAEGSRLNSIGQSAFVGCMLTEIKLPESLISIGASAFSDNFFLSDVDFGEESNLRAIGAYAFYCSLFTGSLAEINLPEGLETLGDFAFMNQSLSGEVYIPAKLSYFGAGAFADNAYLTSFAVDEENSTYNTISGVIYTEDAKTLVAYPTGNTATSYATLSTTETVGAAAFWGAGKLNSLTLNTGLISLEEYSLAYMSALRSIAIPDSVISIARRTFLANMNMSSITFGVDAQISRLGYESLAYTGITSITIPKNVSTIAQGALSGNTKLTSVTFAENSKLESISAYMFDGAESLTSITFLPGSALTSIQAHGLEGMANLTSIDFGDAKLANIDNFALRFCESLTSFTVPETVTNIGRYAFYACYGLTSVTIPESVEHIGSFAFLANPELELYFTSNILPIYLDEDWDHGIKGYYLGVTDVTTDGDFKYATLTDGNVAILAYTGDATALDLTDLGYGNITVIGGDAFAYASLESVVLPETLVTIQRRAFYHSDLKHITIPASVEFIGNAAFADTPIASLTFEDGSALKVIEQSAFERTKALTGSVTIPASVTTLGRAIFRDSAVSAVTFEQGTAITEIPEEAFANSGITAFTAPDSVTKIGDGAFRGAKALKSFSYGTGELWLGANAFYQSGLTSFHIGENIIMIEEFALTSLDNLTAFTVDENNPYYKAIDGLLVSKDGKKLISVPAGLEGSLTVPESIEIIGFGAFEATALDSVTFSPSANILSIGDRAFFGAKNISEITIPASVVSIDYYAFAYAKSLEKVTFAEGSRLTGIYEGAFYGCNRLSDITLPVGIVEISDFAFYGCSKLTKLPVSESAEIKGIYSYAFAYSGLSGELTLPDSLIDIGAYAFLGIKAETVTIPSTNAKELMIGIGAFEDANKLTEITLPFIGASYEDMDITWFGYIFGAGAYEANSAYVPESLNKVNISGDITFIGYGAFYNLASLTEIDVPETVTALYNYAFNNTTAKYELKSAISLWSVDSYGNPVMQKAAYESCFGKGISGHLELADGVTSIGFWAFRDCSSLTSITIPDSVTSIDNYTFSGCSSLTSITIPDSVTSIGECAFKGCSNLTSITIPNRVTSIGYGAFTGCSSLTSITIPDSVTSIGSVAFEGCSSLTSITIPDGVTSIGSVAFCGCSSLTSITIPDGVTNISDSAFYGCSSLTSITIPDSVTSIGECAFTGCSSLTSINIPEGVTSIGSSAFDGCNSLASITIPDSVTSIGSGAFWVCSSLTSINIPDGVTSISDHTFSGCSSLTSVTIGTGVTSIGYRAFDGCSGLMGITIPAGVTSIGYEAFSRCYSLYQVINNSDLELEIGSTENGDIANHAKVLIDKDGNTTYKDEASGFTYVDTEDGFRFTYENGAYTLIAYLGSEDTVTLPLTINGKSYTIYQMRGVRNVIIPDGVTNISDSAFWGCSSLTSITIPDGVTSIGNYTFCGCSSLTSITIPDGVTNISDSAFYGCSSLTGITIPDGVTSIGSSAFWGCSSLTSINTPASVTSIGSGAFGGTALTEINVSKDNAAFTFIEGVLYNKDVTRIIFVPDSVTDICIPKTVTDISLAFRENSNIKTVTFEEGTNITSIGSSEFTGCSSLTSITIPDSVTSIGEWAFEGCSSLTSITIPDSVTSIGNYTFYGCSSLTSITIPDSVTSIGDSAFYGCSSLTSITIPDSVTSIDNYTFSGCSSLTSITIPDGVTSIGYRAFEGCSSLTSITIPDGVTSIGDHTFGYCSSLTSITIPDSVTSIGSVAFEGCSSLTSITIPDSVTSIGSGAFWVCSSLTSINIPDGVTSIDDHTFGYCSSLTSITIPNRVTSIGYGAFTGCSSLTSITIPDSVTSIGSVAFEGCSSLTSINIPDGVTSIGDLTFYGCSSLTSITIPDGVTSIGEWAFWGCSSLTSINIPDGVISIGERAFEGCDRLYQVTNKSDLEFEIGSTENGYIACYAKVIIDKDGNKTYRDEVSGFTYVDTEDGFRFTYENGAYTLIAYLGSEDTVTLPLTINGKSYTIYQMRGVRNVIIPDEITTIGSSAFSGCSSLTSITIPDGVTSIGNYTFYGCSSLTSINIPDSVTSIGYYAFYGCSSLTSINIPDGVTSIGSVAFDGTAYYNNTENWSDGSLYIGNHLIAVDTSVKIFEVREGTVSIAPDAFEGCYSLKHLTLGGDHSILLSSLTNLETLVITEMPTAHYVYDYFGYNNIPITLKNIVLSDGVQLSTKSYYTSHPCAFITGVTIYVEDTERDTQWDANYPGWNNGNKIVYGDEWITAKFYDAGGNLLVSEIFSTSQVIRIPYIEIEGNEQYSYIVEGFDTNGDGIPDTIPATSTTDITAVAVVRQVTNNYTVTFVDKDGVTPIYTVTLPYGSEISLPEAPTKDGYTFKGWQGFTEGMTVTGDVAIYSEWEHEGEGHEYGEPVWIDATCTEGGYNKHVCTVCGEWYATDETESLGHNHIKTTVAPTCTERGYDLYKCACGDEYRESYTEPAGHAFMEWVVDTPATCEDDGLRHHVCYTCSESFDDVIAPTGHSYNSNITKAPTCTKEGEIVYSCVCGDRITEAIPMLEHDYEQKYTSKSFLQWLIETLLDIFFGYEGNRGYYFQCSACGHIATADEAVMTYSSTASVMDACAHELGDFAVIHAVTCTESEVWGSACTLCGEVIEARIGTAPLGHSLEIHEAKAATCTTVGWGEYVTCYDCDYTTYEEIPAAGHTGEYCSVCQVTFTRASISIGKDLTVNYYVALMDESILAEGQTLAVRFTMNGQSTAYVAGAPVNGEYRFAFEHVAPQQMCDLIDATLVILDGKGDVVATVAEQCGYSVKAYAQSALTAYHEDMTDEGRALVQLVTDMLYYGEAAQRYLGYRIDTLATSDVAYLGTPSTALPEDTDKTLSESTSDSAYFTAAGVWFDRVNRLYVRMSTETNVTLKVNGEEVALTGATYYTDAVTAMGFDTVYTFELYEDGHLVQTLTYSINSYAYAKCDSNDTAMAALATALYRYGNSASDYAAIQ